MAKREDFPDLNHKEPGRSKIDRTNVSIEDVVDNIVEISKAWARYEMTIESRHATLTCQRGRDAINTIEDLMRRVRDTQNRFNREGLEG